LAAVAARSKAIFERAEAFAAALARDLDRCAAIHTVMARELAAAYDIKALPPQGRPNLAVFGPLFFVGLIHLKTRCGQKSSCELAAQKVYGLASWKLIVRA
jgi:hypothetical protein